MRLFIFASALVMTLAPTVATAETYRLVHAVGSVEKVSAKGLTKDVCEERKKELKTVAMAVGTGGSVTCLPDSLFDD